MGESVASRCSSFLEAQPHPPHGGVWGGGLGHGRAWVRSLLTGAIDAFIPPAVKAFIPTPEEIAALSALHTTTAAPATAPKEAAAAHTLPATTSPALGCLASKPPQQMTDGQCYRVKVFCSPSNLGSMMARALH
ncbi:hypothetical protein E2C01_002766 [Portunus trituberculatus]|uniref:Uncharacterized protein n=1 Tax=Portunus trituberculatus TaxID=210409 RepID=A0A5B7CP28_PORTR|nr:hypothetical protein [Portunus trituberculatus]